MPTLLITAFEPYDVWKVNASWLTLVEFTCSLPDSPKIVTRLYPVDFATMKKRLAADLAANYDYALHLGQAPGSARIRLEAIGLNVAGATGQSPEQFEPLANDGPLAYRSGLPLAAWALKLRAAGIPAQVSYHAGTYLCNGMLYYSCYLAERLGLRTRAAFVHLPLAPSQTLEQTQDVASMPVSTSAKALRLMVEDLADGAV